MPHKLNNNEIQFEGYDKDMKHLFTFRIAYNDTEANPDQKRSGSLAMESEFSNEETEQFNKTYGESMIEGDRLTEYDVTE